MKKIIYLFHYVAYISNKNLAEFIYGTIGRIFFMIMNYYDYEMELMYMVVKKSQNPKIGGMFTLDS